MSFARVLLVAASLTSIVEFSTLTPLTFPNLHSVSTRTFPNRKRPFAIPPYLPPTPSLLRHATYSTPFVPALSGSELKRAFQIILVHLCRFEINRTGSCSFDSPSLFPCSPTRQNETQQDSSSCTFIVHQACGASTEPDMALLRYTSEFQYWDLTPLNTAHRPTFADLGHLRHTASMPARCGSELHSLKDVDRLGPEILFRIQILGFNSLERPTPPNLC